MLILLPFVKGLDVRTASGCFTRWGSQDCPASHTRTLKGYVGGVEAYYPLTASVYSQPGGSNLVCVSDHAEVLDDGYNYEYRLYQALSDGSGGALVSTGCAVCCDAGCYAAFGTQQCDDGYVTQYEGRPDCDCEHRRSWLGRHGQDCVWTAPRPSTTRGSRRGCCGPT